MKRNVIVLMLDTVRAGDVYGKGSVHNLNRMAEHGTAYLNTIAPGTWTAPTHAALFMDSKVSKIKGVSQNFFRNGTKKIDPWMVHTQFLDKSARTVAAKLSELGYYSVLFSNNPFLTSYTNLATGFDKIYDVWKDSNSKYDKKSVDRVSFMFNGGTRLRSKVFKACHAVSKMIPGPILDRVYMDLRLRLDRGVAAADGTYRLDRGAQDTNKVIAKYLKYNYNYAPQFIFVNYIEAHENYPVASKEVVQDKWLYLSGIEELTDYRAKMLHNAYERRLSYLDKKVGDTISTLKKAGMLDNATVIVTSDHGQLFGEHGGLYHAMPPYEGVSKVPLIAVNYENGKVASDRDIVETPVSLLSLHDAILNLASGKYERLNGNLRRDKKVFCEHTGILEGWDEQLLSLLKNRSKMADKIYRAKRRYNRRVTAVYQGDLKLLHFFGQKKDELYDVSKDPLETTNIIDANRHAAQGMLS